MNVFSMFDGVGGFIVGLNNSDPEVFTTTYSNQYEPGRKTQDAYEVGCYRFRDMHHDNRDIATIPDEDFEAMANAGVDMIVGGFPCQDYSVAKSKSHAMGIVGKKGVLFWEIIRATRIIMPKYLVLENVDRLLKSPSKQRGRDFAVMLAAFNELDYSVEWRVINAADYGRAQRRRRVFFFVYRNDSGWAEHIEEEFENNEIDDENKYNDYILTEGLFADQFNVENHPLKNRLESGELARDIPSVSKKFEGQFWNAGIMRHGRYYTMDTIPVYEAPIPLRNILLPESQVDESYRVTGEKLRKFKKLRAAKKIERTSKDGHKYTFSEGSMSPKDELHLPARTMLTSEGTVNRSTHLVYKNKRYRTITPIEAERLQDFPDDWTRYKLTAEGEEKEVSARMRMFFMGNALVTGIVTRIGDGIKEIEEQYP